MSSEHGTKAPSPWGPSCSGLLPSSKLRNLESRQDKFHKFTSAERVAGCHQEVIQHSTYMDWLGLGLGWAYFPLRYFTADILQASVQRKEEMYINNMVKYIDEIHGSDNVCTRNVIILPFINILAQFNKNNSRTHWRTNICAERHNLKKKSVNKY